MNSSSRRRRFDIVHLLAFAVCTLAAGGPLAPDLLAQDRPVDLAAKEPKPRVVWQYAPAGSNFADVLVRSGLVLVLDRAGTIQALDAASGELEWTSDGRRQFSFGFGMALSPAPDFAAVLVGCDTGLYALDVATGTLLWHTPVALGVAGPACTADAVVAGSADGKVYACDLRTGKRLWQNDYLEDRPADPDGFDGARARFDGRPARPGAATTDGKMVALSIFDQCRTLAFDVPTGKRLWDFRTEGWMYGRPTIGPRNVYVGSQDKHFYAVDKDLGKLTWKVATGARVEGAAAFEQRFVYFGSCDGNLYAADEAVGRVAWQFATEREAGRGAPIYGCPVVIGDVVYLAALRGKVYAVERETGKLIWDLLPLPKSELNSALVTDGERLFVTTRKSGDEGVSAVLAIGVTRG